MLFKRNKYTTNNDEELLILYKSSFDKRIIGELYLRYGHLVYGLCLKLLQNKNEAEDKTMVIFESLYKKLTQHEVANFKSWLYTVVRNECYMQLRKRKNQMVELHSDRITLEDDDLNATEMELQLEGLENALEQLKPEQQEAIRLFYLNDLSYKEISLQTGWDIKKVKSLIQNAKRNIKILLEENHVDKFTT